MKRCRNDYVNTYVFYSSGRQRHFISIICLWRFFSCCCFLWIDGRRREEERKNPCDVMWCDVLALWTLAIKLSTALTEMRLQTFSVPFYSKERWFHCCLLFLLHLLSSQEQKMAWSPHYWQKDEHACVEPFKTVPCERTKTTRRSF